jgi:DNA-directed RNA polymerase specialized sigma subunit
MTAEEFLLGPARLKAEIASDMDNLAALRTVAESCTSHLDLVAGGHTSDSHRKLEDLTVAIADEEEKLRDKIAAVAILEKNVLEVIRQLSNSRYRCALIMRFLQGKSWQEISKALYLSKSSIYAILREAIHELEKIMKEQGSGRG